MALDIAIEVGSKIVELLIVPVGRQIDYAWNCEEHIDNLKGEVQTVKEARGRLQRRFKDARKRGEMIESDTEKWLKDADQFIERADEFLQADDRVNKKCFGVLCPDCKTRYQRGRKAKKRMLKEVAHLCTRKDKLDGGFHRKAPPSLRPVKDYESFGSRTSTFKDIMQALADPSVMKIGLYGIDGVGKTSLVKEIAWQAKEENLFDEVVIATVFQDHIVNEMLGQTEVMKKAPDIRRIQGEIAEGLDFPFHYETERVRASELRERLKDESRKLLILDNIWAGLELEDLGIPCDHKGCKLLMTSTNQKVLSSQMDSKNNFFLDTLPFDEAWDWFKRMVGDVFKDPGLEEVANKVADRCGGLPILLIPVAKGLKGNADLYTWKKALEQLSSFDKHQMHSRVDLGLQISYNRLAGDEIKLLFLLCGQLNPISIEYLLKYVFGLGLFKQSNTLEKGRSTLLKLVDDLKDSCLLLEGDSPGIVKMHDIIRGFAVSTAFKDHNVFTVGLNNTLEEWPVHDVLVNLTAIYLEYCEIPDLPEVLECPKLELFLLSSNDLSLKIPDNFFERTTKLKVLDLTKINFSQLPPSLKSLENLRTLCLDWCILKDIAMIGKLKKLQVLSLSGSDIILLPQDIGQLSSLRLLDLSHCKRLEVIPPNVLSSLPKLEELKMENMFLQWDIEGLNTKRTNACLDELKCLSNLSTLHIHITDAKMLPKGLFSENLERFRIFIGEGWDWSEKYKTSRTLKIKLNKNVQWEKGLKGLLKKTEDLYLDELKGIQSCLYELDVFGFRQLKHLHIENSSDIQFVVNSTGMGHCSAFVRLESLLLDNLPNLKKIYNGRLVPESFSNLRRLEVGSCDALENLVSSCMARGFLHLEQIKINDCKSLKEIVSFDGKDRADNNEAIVFPQLQKLVLDSLPQFSRFCSKMKTNSLCLERRSISEITTTSEAIVRDNETEMPLFDEKIPIPNLKELKLSSIIISKIWNEHITEVACLQNLTSLTTDGCNNLKYLFSSSLLESLVNLQTLQVSNCRMMQQVIATEAFGEGMNKVTFRQLDFLQLQNLPELAQVCTGNLFECPALKELSVMNCPRLRCFVSKYGQENKAMSDRVEPTNFFLFDEKVALPNLEKLEINNMNTVTTIWHNELLDDSFSKLKRLYISDAEELVKVFPSNYVSNVFKNVESLSVAHCNSLEEIFGFQAITNSTHSRVAIQLKTLELENLPNLKHICNKGAVEVLSFSNLRSVNVLVCPKLRSVFPASVARDLSQLTYVDINDCGVEEIVSKDEGEDLIADFYFAELTHLRLWKLPELKRFYPGTHAAEYPKLKYVDVYDCAKIGIFTSECQDLEEPCSDDQIKISLEQPLLSAEKIIPNLEELTLNSNDARMLWEGQFPADQLSNEKVLHLQCFEDESATFPFRLIQRFNNLESLDIGDSYFKEIFANDCFADLENRETYLEKIRVLRLDLLYDLKQIRLDHVLKNLAMLEIITCHSLTILAPASASFPNLIVLDVKNCNGLVNLITSSTAKSLVQLKEMSVTNCTVLKEILANEGDEGKAEINFHKLESLRLDCLTSLSNFCSAVFSLRFPSLEKVFLKQCPKMTNFSRGDLHTPKLRRVQTEGRDKIRWMGDLNATVQQLYSELAGFNSLERMDLSEFPELKGKWPDQLPVRFFDKLKSLVVDDCASSSSAISSNILPSLVLLEELTVRNCNSVEEVFDFGQPDASVYAQHLSKLTMFQLVDLRKLKHVWNENAKRMLDFRKLKQIKIQKCGSLRCLFTPSLLMSLNQLQEMEVKSCPRVEAIVAKEAEHDTIVFPKLNSITLEDLPNITCFYSGKGICEFPSLTMVAVIDCPKAFTSSFLGEQEQSTSNEDTEAKIIIPNLKEMKLSSILIDRIWDVKILEISSCVKNLTRLTVSGCHNLKYLFSSSIAAVLVNLKTLLVISCWMMEEIIFNKEFGEESSHVTFSHLDHLWLENLPRLAQVCSCDLFECPALKELKIVNCPKLSAFVSTSGEEIVAVSNDADPTNFSLFDEKVAFPNLEKLEITDMKCVKMIWHEILRENSFFKLKQLSLSNVEELVGIFPSNYMLSNFTNLEALSIARCNLLKKIIGFEAMTNSTHETAATELKTPELKQLSNMKRIWNNDAVETLSFSKMQKVDVSDCPNLKSLFPALVAKGLLQLTSIRITQCGIEEIVSAEKGKELLSDFAFPRLTHIQLWGLPKLKRFYPGQCTAKFPELKNLTVYNCEKFGVFTTESQFFQEQCFENEIESSQEKPLLSAEKVIPTLEELTLNPNDARMLWEGQFSADLLCNVECLRLQCFHDESTMFPLRLIQRFNNLDSLVLLHCCFREIFLHDGYVDEKNQAKNLGTIRVLWLHLLYNLKQIKGDYLLKSLEELDVRQCDSLTSLALPSAFQNLKVLYVQSCGGLVSLITPSTAESLVQLTELRVANCEKLREILANEGDERKADIIFHKLESLRLDCLESLTNFCSAACTLRFPALEEVILKQCPKMTIFSKGDLHAPKLGMVKTESTVYKPHWMGNLNATVKQMYAELAGLDGVWQMKLSEFPDLKSKWPDELPVKFFGNLWSLVVDDCAFCSIAVPSELLPSLNVLEELEVRHCDSVEEVFDVGQPSRPISTEHLSRLTKFHLVDLPKLKHLWTQNVQEMLDLGELKQIKIQNCGSLRYVFTPSMLLGLSHLQEMEVRSCPAIEEIVAKDEAVEETVAKDEADDAVIFPLLNSVTFEDLPKLTSYYTGSGIVKFPCLKMVAIFDCPNTFTLSFLKGQEQSTSDEATEAKVAFPSLENLKVIWDDAIDELIQAGIFCKLKVFELIRFPDDHAAFPSHIFQKLPCLEHLVLSDAAFEEISLHTETNDKECLFGIATLIKELEVSKFPNLTVFSTGSRSQLLLQDLQSLRVSECVNLKLLLPVSVSFERLTVLEVSKCHGLINLISNAESLEQITTLRVTECQMMTEIVAEEERIAGNVIIFRKLKCLRLKSLPKLTKFYSGKCALMFPTLEEVYLSESPKLKAFSQGEVNMPKLKKLQLPMGEDEGYGKGSHYVHLQRLFVKMKQTAAQSRSLSLLGHRNEEFHIVNKEKVPNTVEIAPEDLHTSTNPNSSKDLAVDGGTSTDKNDSTEGEDIPCNSKENGTRICLQTIAAKKDEVSPDSFIPRNEGDPPESIRINLEHTYLDHVGLLKKILTKPLSEVSRSQDADVLLSILENLKNCPHLNSQQSEIIQHYIEHFDTLVIYQSFYEDQIGRASALQVSLQEDRKQMPELKTLYDNLADKTDSISADKEELNKKLEALKKKLQEVEQEEKQVRAEMEILRADLLTKNMKQDALPKASMRQKEALDKARSADDHWTKLRDLFA